MLAPISHRSAPVLGPVLVLCLLLAPGLRAQEEAAAPQTSLQAFEALYAEVGTETAEELAFDLKTELIRRDAEIEVLKLEAARFDGERQQQALDRLVTAAAARERQIIDHTRRLEALSGTAAPCVEGASLPAAAASTAGETAPTAEAAAADAKPKGKKGKYKIVFEAEDLIDNPDS